MTLLVSAPVAESRICAGAAGREQRAGIGLSGETCEKEDERE